MTSLTNRTRRALLAGAVAVGVAAAAAVAATSASRRDGGGDAMTTAVAGSSVPGAVVGSSGRIVHEFTASHVGPVWLTVVVEDGAEHVLEIAWGPWQRAVTQRERGPVTYWFEKKDPESVPVSVEVPDGASATFGEGPQVPAGAVDARPGWNRRPPSVGGGASAG
jgi:hypothetical protein